MFEIMDPLKELNSEMIEEVFQYLTVNELLVSSLVSQSWNEFISNSNKCMKRMKIKMSTNELSLDRGKIGVEYFKKSKRKYKNLMINRVSDPMYNDCSLVTFVPKEIQMQCGVFSTQNNFQSIMEITQNSVEILHLEHLIFGDGSNDSLALSYCFPKLNELTLMSCQFDSEVFIIANNLTTLNLTTSSELLKPIVVAAFLNLMSFNNHLQALSLSGNIITQIFCDDISDKIRFKLTKFKVTNLNVRSFYNRSTIENNLNLFLKTQLKIEKLILGDSMGTMILETIFNEMKFLKYLTFMELLGEIPTNLKSNTSIVRLEYQDIFRNISYMESLLEATPNLRSLSLKEIDQEMLQMLAYKISNLEYLSVSFFDASDIVYPIFPKLKEFTSSRLNKILIRKITLKKPEDRNHFENLIYECHINQPPSISALVQTLDINVRNYLYPAIFDHI